MKKRKRIRREMSSSRTSRPANYCGRGAATKTSCRVSTNRSWIASIGRSTGSTQSWRSASSRNAALTWVEYDSEKQALLHVPDLVYDAALHERKNPLQTPADRQIALGITMVIAAFRMVRPPRGTTASLASMRSTRTPCFCRWASASGRKVRSTTERRPGMLGRSSSGSHQWRNVAAARRCAGERVMRNFCIRADIEARRQRVQRYRDTPKA